MKKTTSLLLVTMLLLFLTDCNKKGPSNTMVSDGQLIEAARQYFNRNVSVLPGLAGSGNPNVRLRSGKVPVWSQASILSLRVGKAVVVPVEYTEPLYIRTSFSGQKLFSLDERARLLIYPDGRDGLRAELVTSFPDEANLLNPIPFTGVILVEDWVGHSVAKLQYYPGGRIVAFAGDSPGGLSGKVKQGAAVPHAASLQICDEIEGYNYAPDAGGEAYFWTEEVCSYAPVDVGGLADAGGGISGAEYGGVPPAGSSDGQQAGDNTVVITTGVNPIGNIQDYMKCYTNVGGNDHIYTVTVCVNQPVPGSRQPWGFTSVGSSAGRNVFNVGHTFLIMSETTPTGTTTRNVGFYPHGIVNPWSPSDQGELNNNASSDYNISLTVTVDNAQFFNMINFIEQGNDPGYMYDLNGNNCTSFALHTLGAGGVFLPSTVGYWTKGSGNDPGDLGEDLRSMPLSSNMSLSTNNTSHPNLGNCN